jgi:hypothetical protein
MSMRAGVVWFLVLAALFLAMNRDAYRGYFRDDELDNLSWAPHVSVADYLKGIVTPRFFENNFRPVGHFYFYAAEAFFGLEFPGYVAVIHAIHLLNVWLLWLLARRLGASPVAAAGACAFFAFHMALFDAVWKPMYVFDVSCATFCLLSLLLYSRQRWLLSLAAFWLAYKCKELAVMLPLALALYELWFGKRRWKPLAPFFLVSASFGLQGMLMNPNRDNDYTFRFTAEALAKTSVFYAGRVFLIPYLGFVLPLAAIVARNRRTWFGLAMMAAFLLPLLFLPGRLYSAYCYLPFTGLAIAFAGIAEASHAASVALFLALWLPLDIHSLRLQRRETLAQDTEVRTWVATATRFTAARPQVDGFIFSGAPVGFQRWGIEGALKYLFDRNDLKIAYEGEPMAAGLLSHGKVAYLRWDSSMKRLTITVRPTVP